MTLSTGEAIVAALETAPITFCLLSHRELCLYWLVLGWGRLFFFFLVFLLYQRVLNYAFYVIDLILYITTRETVTSGSH